MNDTEGKKENLTGPEKGRNGENNSQKGDALLSIRYCSDVAQKILNTIKLQLKKDGLFNGDVIVSLKRTLPAIKQIAREGSSNCNQIIEKFFIERAEEAKEELKEEIKEQIKNMEFLAKRKDHYTRFLLNPFEEVITNGEIMEVTPDSFPRKIICVIKEAVELMVPPILQEESKELSNKIVALYQDQDKEGGTDWESIAMDWRVVTEAVASHRAGLNKISWEDIHNKWKSAYKDEKKIDRLKTIGEIILPNENILRKLITELTNPETMESDRAKLRERIAEHAFLNMGHEPEEDECDLVCDNLLKVLSKGLPENKV